MSIVNLPVEVALAVRAVAGFGAVSDVRVAPTDDFVTELLDVVVFFARVDVTPASVEIRKKNQYCYFGKSFYNNKIQRNRICQQFSLAIKLHFKV